MDVTFLLKSCRLFSDLEGNELAAIQRIAQRRDYHKGQIIFSETDPTHGFFIVVSGAVKIFRTGQDGRERILHVVEAGETFAEATIFMDEYPATAATLAASTIILIEKNGFRQLLAHNQKLTSKIFVSMAMWLRELCDTLTELTLKEVPARFASYVLSLPAEPNKPIKIAISKTTVAQMLGTTKETFSRLLHRLAQHRVLTYRGHQIKILNRQRLERIAQGNEKI